MTVRDKAKKQLLSELIELRQQISKIKSFKKENMQSKKYFADSKKVPRGSEIEYQKLADNFFVGVYQTSLKNDILYVNKAMARMAGYKSSEEMMKEGALRLYKNKKERDVLIKKLKKMGKVSSFNVDLLRKTGETMRVLISAVLEGDIISVIIMDITKLKNAEESLKASEEKYRNLVESSTDMIFVVDRKSDKIIDINDAVCKYMGYSRNEIIGTKAGSRVIGSHKNAFKKEFANHRKFGKFSGEFILRRKDGTTFPAEIRGSAMSNYLYAFARDISERKHAEEVLKESEEKFKGLSEQSPNMIFINKKGKIVYFNEQCEKVMGYGKKEFYSSDFDFLTLIAPEYRDLVMANFRRHMQGHKVEPCEYVLITKEGKRIDTIITTRIISYEGENAILGIITDITDRKKMEDELHKTQKLESIGELAGGIAHSFNNLLTAIDGNISLAKMYAKPGLEIYDILVEAEKASLRAKNLVQQLLTFSKGEMPLKEVVSVAKLINDSMVFALSGSNVRCEFFIQDDLWTVKVDKDQVSQVINNLLVNAMQSMPGGGVIKVRSKNITISTENLLPLKNGKHIMISIEDNGTGIREKDLRKIFDPYFTTKRGGSGLGLTSAYSIIKKHDGHITVESKIGVGTTFTVYLPVVDEKIMTMEGKDKIPIYGRIMGKILVMDDEEIVRDVIDRMITQCGYEAEFAIDGAEAIKIFKKAKASGQPFDAVILDLIVPGGMGGKETIKKLSKIDPDIKAIVSSGYSKDPVMAKFKEYGFNSFLSKPYKLADLCKALNKVILGTDE